MATRSAFADTLIDAFDRRARALQDDIERVTETLRDEAEDAWRKEHVAELTALGLNLERQPSRYGSEVPAIRALRDAITSDVRRADIGRTHTLLDGALSTSKQVYWDVLYPSVAAFIDGLRAATTIDELIAVTNVFIAALA